MEIISKAVAIVLAFIGMTVGVATEEVNQIHNNRDEALSVLAVQAHNAMFDSYIDKNVKGNAVKDLCAKIGTYNKAADENFKVIINMDNGIGLVYEDGLVIDEKTGITNISNKVYNEKIYLITEEFNTEGIITNITVKENNYIDTLAVQAHNSMFDSYLDRQIKGRNIKDLCAKIALYNQNVDSQYIVTIKMANGINLVDKNGLVQVFSEEYESSITNLSIEIESSKNYLVKVFFDDKTGLITNIIIKEV